MALKVIEMHLKLLFDLDNLIEDMDEPSYKKIGFKVEKEERLTLIRTRNDLLKKLPDEKRKEIEADINKVYESRPQLAMVDSRIGKTNLHVPNDIIIDASMPNVVRDGGKMWNLKDELQDCIAAIPDRSYSTMYGEIIEDVKANRHQGSSNLTWGGFRIIRTSSSFSKSTLGVMVTS